MGLVQNWGVVLQSECSVVSSLWESMFLKLSGRSSCFPDNTQNCLAPRRAVGSGISPPRPEPAEQIMLIGMCVYFKSLKIKEIKFQYLLK